MFSSSVLLKAFLHFSSCHPLDTFRTILKGEILRTLRCTSSPTKFITILDKLLQKFRERGYPEWIIRQESEDINHSQRKKLMSPTDKRTQGLDTTFFSSTFTPGIKSSAIRTALEDRETPFSTMVLRPRPTPLQETLFRAKISNRTLEDNGGPR